MSINRGIDRDSCCFNEVFQGFEKVEAVKAIFGDETDSILSKLKLVLRPLKGYLYVDDETGSIVVNTQYLRTGDERHLYLDAIHELVHVRQFREGKELFDKRYSYVDRPTEIEAYSVAVEEARRIGMGDEEIVDYLRVEWVTEEEFQRLLVKVGVKPRPIPDKP